jgi:hypothetical protein
MSLSRPSARQSRFFPGMGRRYLASPLFCKERKESIMEVPKMQAFAVRTYPMKRNMDLIRDILVLISEDPKYDGTKEFYFETPEEFGIHDHSVEEVAYHLALLIDSGYVDGAVTAAAPMQVIRTLTMRGHDFLGSVSDPSVWEKTKQRLKGLYGVALPIVEELAKSEMKKHLGLTP